MWLSISRMSRLNIPSNSQQIIGKNKQKERKKEQVWTVFKFQVIQVGPESSLCIMGKGKEMEFEEKGDA